MNQFENTTLAEIIERNYNSIAILEKYTLDCSIKGNQTIETLAVKRTSTSEL